VIVGERQIHEPLDEISQSDLRIAVLHHSQDWLEYFGGERVWSRLWRECNFILHGYGRVPKATAEHDIGGDCVIIPAGASSERRIAKDPSHINSYNLVHLDLEIGRGIVFLRRWNDEMMKWVRYEIDDKTRPEGKFTLYLPGHMSVQPGPLSLIRSGRCLETLLAAKRRLRPSCMDFRGWGGHCGPAGHGRGRKDRAGPCPG
jgi:hypothetical protein